LKASSNLTDTDSCGPSLRMYRNKLEEWGVRKYRTTTEDGGRYGGRQRSVIPAVPEELNDQASDRARVNVDRPNSQNPLSWLVKNLAPLRADSQLPKNGIEKAAEGSPDGSVPITMQPTIEQRAQQHLDFAESRLAGSSMHQVIQSSNTSKTTRAEESITLEDEEGEARGELIEEQRVCCFCSNRFVKS
jgi:hypothetical protein